MAFLGNSLPFCPETILNMFLFLTPGEHLGACETQTAEKALRVEGAIGQAAVVHPHSGSALTLGDWVSQSHPFCQRAAGHHGALTVKGEDGNGGENLVFYFKRGQKPKRFFADNSVSTQAFL